MIAPPYDEDDCLPNLRHTYRVMRIPAIALPHAVMPAGAAGLRIRLAGAGWTPYWIADRGKYSFNDALADPVLFEELMDLAERIAEARLRAGRARWTRMVYGDYTQLKDDAKQRFSEERHIEVTLDFSERSCGEAEVVYTDGLDQLYAFPQMAESIAIVERAPTTFRFDRYLNHRVREAEVLRLRLSLPFA